MGALDQAMLCSAKDCQSEATWALLWNNPKLHTPERRKEWRACDEHRESLSAFLSARGFLKDVEPVSPLPEGPPPGAGSP